MCHPKTHKTLIPAQLQHHRWMNIQKIVGTVRSRTRKVAPQECREQWVPLRAETLWFGGKCQSCDGLSHLGSPHTDGGCVIFFRKGAKGQGIERFQVLSHFLLVLRADALCAGFEGFAQHNIKHRQKRTEWGDTKAEESGGELAGRGSSFSKHFSRSELCCGF